MTGTLVGELHVWWGRLQSAREPGTESAITDTAPEKLAHEEEQGSRTVTPRKCGGEILKHSSFKNGIDF